MALNYYAINQVLGGKMVEGARPRFGGFGLLDLTAGALARRPRKPKLVVFDHEMDVSLIRAFEEIRKGASPEKVLWDPEFGTKFHARARRLGVHAPAAQLNRRLLTIRKSPRRYRNLGITLSPTTSPDPEPGIVPRYAHLIEFALVKLRNLYNATIDDILIDPELAGELDRLAVMVDPTLTPKQVRLGALYLRKSRRVEPKDSGLFERLDASDLDSAVRPVGTLASLSPGDIPPGEGLFELLEEDRYLYIAWNSNIRDTVKQLLEGSVLKLLGNDFWKPTLSDIRVQVHGGSQFERAPVQLWQLKLIQTHNPVFNWPMPRAA